MEDSPITKPDYTVTDRRCESSVISSVSTSTRSEEEVRAFERFLKIYYVFIILFS
jgi:hypothetical protein